SYVAAADLNADSKLDLVVANYDDATVSILAGNGDGTFGRATNYLVSPKPSGLIITDFNFDGRLDVVVGIGNPGLVIPDLNLGPGASSGAVAVLLGYGDGTFQGEANYPLNNGSIKGGYPGAQAIAAGDFNGDGFPDIATVNIYNQNVSLLF